MRQFVQFMHVTGAQQQRIAALQAAAFKRPTLHEGLNVKAAHARKRMARQVDDYGMVWRVVTRRW